jgi:hypothetical protein
MTLAGVLDLLDTPFRWLVGASRGSTYLLTRWVFLRALGLILLIAFISVWVQIRGLIGSQGILPAQDLLQAARRIPSWGGRIHALPSVLWLGASDAALQRVCAVGGACALLLMLDVAPLVMLAASWTLYLSIVAVGSDFMAFQWDVLLLETTLLAVLLAPWQLLPGRGAAGTLPALMLFLLWWLLFRLSFESGVVKLTWGDPTWRNLSALDFHYYSQPLPTWTAWFMAQLPEWFKRLSVVVTLLLEIGFPCLMFGPRSLRLVGCAGIMLLQLMILGTGNYNFFNLLAIAIALLLLDDRFWSQVLPQRVIRLVTGPAAGGYVPVPVRLALTVAALALLGLSVASFARSLAPRDYGTGGALALARAIPQRQRVWIVSGDDHVAQRDRGRRLGRRGALARVRIPLQAR